MAIKKSAARGRPRSFDADKALDVAQRLFHERGYDAVGVADIGKALGISPPSFYNAFGSKAALYERVLDRYSSTSFINQILERTDSISEVITALLDEAARRYADAEGISGCLVLDGARNSGDAEAQAQTRKRNEQTRELITARIAQDVPAKAKLRAGIVMIALNGLSASAREGASEAELAAFARAVARSLRKEFSRPA